MVFSLSTERYILASVLGLLPTQTLNIYIGSTLRSMEEVHEYNRMTGCSLELDFFTFDPWVHVMEEFVPQPDLLQVSHPSPRPHLSPVTCHLVSPLHQLEDISHGEERMPISASNCYDSSYPPFIRYSTKPIPQVAKHAQHVQHALQY